jgi:hypothetical protein
MLQIKFSGDTPIVYLILNKTLRKAVFKLIRDFVRASGNSRNVIGNSTMFVGSNNAQTNHHGSVNRNTIRSQDINFENESHPHLSIQGSAYPSTG